MTPARARVTWASRVHQQQSLSGAECCGLHPPQLCTEPIYGTQYDLQPLPQSWLEVWSNGMAIDGLHLPLSNPFVPDDLSLLPVLGEKEGLPILLVKEAGMRLWHRTDLRFENPKGTIVLDFQVSSQCPRRCQLFCRDVI